MPVPNDKQDVYPNLRKAKQNKANDHNEENPVSWMFTLVSWDNLKKKETEYKNVKREKKYLILIFMQWICQPQIKNTADLITCIINMSNVKLIQWVSSVSY